MQFKWIGPENWKVSDAGGEHTHMSTFVDHYECDEFGGKVKEWKAKNWIRVI